MVITVETCHIRQNVLGSLDLYLYLSFLLVKPEKSTIVLKEKCSHCGRDVLIEITPTSGGFGLMGGALFKGSLPEKYFAKCSACCKIKSNIKITVKKQNSIR